MKKNSCIQETFLNKTGQLITKKTNFWNFVIVGWLFSNLMMEHVWNLIHECMHVTWWGGIGCRWRIRWSRCSGQRFTCTLGICKSQNTACEYKFWSNDTDNHTRKNIIENILTATYLSPFLLRFCVKCFRKKLDLSVMILLFNTTKSVWTLLQNERYFIPWPQQLDHIEKLWKGDWWDG